MSNNLSLQNSIYHLFWHLFFPASFSLFSVPSSFPSSSSHCAGDISSPSSTEKIHLKTSPQPQSRDLFTLIKLQNFILKTYHRVDACLKNLERLQIISFFFLTLQKVLQPTRLMHRYCCFLESCRNQPHIWYQNNLVFSVTKIGLLWNFNPIYAKL